ncbi:MAG: Flp family type IVb pilin [Terriglobia bacterium]|nr:Flp family type IVb pilin [Terriglobia bacterium]
MLVEKAILASTISEGLFMSRMLKVLRGLHKDESAQDLIEYALVAALIAFAAIAGMSSLASSINVAFSKIGSRVNAYIG